MNTTTTSAGSINLVGRLEDPLDGSPDVGAQVRFTMLSNTGNSLKTSTQTLIVDPSGEYDITLAYGNIQVEYKTDVDVVNWTDMGIIAVNADTTAATIPQLLNSTVPPTDENILIFQSLLAQSNDAADRALASANEAAATATLVDGVQESVAAEGDAQYARVQAEGDVQFARIQTEGADQYDKIVEQGLTSASLIEAKGNTAFDKVVDAETDALKEIGDKSTQEQSILEQIRTDANAEMEVYVNAASNQADSAVAEVDEAKDSALVEINTKATNEKDALEQIRITTNAEMQTHVDEATSQAEAAKESADEIKSTVLLTYSKSETDALLKNKVNQDSATGAANLPTGTTGQRPLTPQAGDIRYNTQLKRFEGFSDGDWGDLGGSGATGAKGNPAFYENDNVITADYTITTGKNAMTAGPIEIANDVTVTVPDGSTWTVV